MFTRYLGGVAACLGVAGTLAAQQPAALLSRPKNQAAPTQPAQAPPVRFGGSQPIQAGPPAMLPGTAVARQAPTPGAPAAGTPAAPQPAPKTATPTPSATPAPTTAAAGPGCGPAGCPPAADCSACDCLCGPPGRVWVSGEWLYWAASGNPLPALVTGAPAGTGQAVAGTIGGPGTTTLFGDRRANNDFRSGFRVNAGMWLDECQTLGVEGFFHFLGQSRERFTAGSDGSRIITRPFVNALTGAQDTQLVSFPGVLAGTVGVTSTNDVIGWGANLVKNLCCDPCGRTDLLLGYRYLNVRDDLTIREDLTALANAPAGTVPGTTFVVNDRFQTRNTFHGPSVGLRWERRWSHWYVNARASVAMGVSRQEVTISGSTVITPPGGPAQTFPGGLLAQPTNIGRFTSNHFAVLPEVGVRVGCQVTENLRAFVGYDFAYLSSVARAGDQIDLRVNTNQLPPPGALNGPAVPAFRQNRTDFWLQGVSVGAEFRF